MIINPYLYAAGGGGGDPDFAGVTALFHFDGANGDPDPFANVITGSSGDLVRLAGTTQLSTTQHLFGATSLLLASGGHVANTGGTTDFAFGTGDYSIEWSQYCSALGIYNIVLFGPGTAAEPVIYSLSDGSMYLYTNSTNRISTPAATMVVNTWQQCGIFRVAGNTRFFVDGVQVGSTYVDSSNIGNSALELGYNSFSFDGFLAEVRTTKGVGRQTATYTPEAGPFPDF